MRLLEGVGVALQQQEPALLVGETGTGKTTLVQRLADQARATAHHFALLLNPTAHCCCIDWFVCVCISVCVACAAAGGLD